MKKASKSIIILIPFIVFIVMMCMDDNLIINNCQSLIYLPLFFGIISIIFIDNIKRIFDKISYTLIYSLFFIRLVLIPLITCFVDIENLDIHIYAENQFLTVFLLIYEFFFVMLISYIYYKKNKYNKEEKKQYAIDKEVKNSYFILAWILGIIFCVILFRYPNLKHYFKFLLDKSSVQTSIESYKNTLEIEKSVPSIVYLLFKYIFFVLYFLVPFLIINRIKNTKLKNKNKVLCSLIVIFITGCITTTDDKAISVFVSIALLMIIAILYKEAKKYLKFVYIFVACCVFYALFAKNGNTIMDESLLDTLSSYFSGPFYVAYVFKMGKGVNIQSLLKDIPASTSFIMYFFKDTYTCNKMFNYCIYNNNLIVNKIIPMVSQSCYYFGIVMAPLLSIITAYIAFYFEKRFYECNNLAHKYILIYLCILFSVSPIIYNFSIIVTNLSGIGLFLFLIYVFGKIKFK